VRSLAPGFSREKRELSALSGDPPSSANPTAVEALLKKGRITFIDALRGLAVVWMIQTHVVNACLDASYKMGVFFHGLNLANGFVGPTFIFCAGAGFWLAVERKGGEYRRLGKGFWIYLRRLALILAIGYWLHLPVFSLVRLLHAPREKLMGFYSIDVLQLIVISSLVALCLFFIFPHLKWFAWGCVAMTAAVIRGTPFIWQLDPFSFLPAPLAMLLARQPPSRFPLFPWSAYLFAGVAVTALYRAHHRPGRLARIMVIISSLVIMVIFLVPGLPISYVGRSEWWLSSSSHALFRTLGVILIFFLFSLAEPRFPKPIGQFLQCCGQESLFVYVVHLLIVYGSSINSGLSYLSGGKIGPLTVIIYTLAITVFSYYGALLWHEAKTKNPPLAKKALVVVIASFMVVFAAMP
jgi:uncharacterized membrane protein